MKLNFDFEIVYSKYPWRLNQNKKSAMKRLNSMIKTIDDYEKLIKATEHYATYVKKMNIQPQYIKAFSTFVNNFEDWIEIPLPFVNKNRAPDGIPKELLKKEDPRENSNPEFVKSLMDKALKR